MKYIFGPVASRRLGYSLGVEVIPSKTCSFACIYCQVGKTTTYCVERDEYVPTKEVMSELEQALPRKDLHYVTFSGSGEPTLHIHLGKLIDKAKSLSNTPVCVITNSSLIHRKDVRRDLAKADVVIPSLDAMSPEAFAKINRPAKGITPDKILSGLIKFRNAFTGEMRLEIMLVKGINDSPEEIAKLKEAAQQIEPDVIDLNTVVRPPAENYAKALEQTEMERIAGVFGDKVRIVSSFDKMAMTGGNPGLDEEIYQLVRRRGITLSDLTTGMGLHKDVAVDILNRLLEQGKIKKVSHGGQSYYRENY